MSEELSPAPLHIRFVGQDENNPTGVQVYVQGDLTHEIDFITPGDMARLVADVYGMPITMDRVDEKPAEQLTVMTADHMNNGILYDALGYNGDIHIMHARHSMGRAINAKIIEAAKRVGVPTDLIADAVRKADNPESPGNYRVYAVQRRMNPAYAQFLAAMFWVPENFSFHLAFSTIAVREGEFGKDGEVNLEGMEF